MNERLHAVFLDVINQIIGYFPRLLAGVALLVVGWGLAWFVKRLVVQLSVILRLDRLLTRSRWGAGFERADVRYGFYNFIGNIFFVAVFLIFLDFAFLAWDLKLLSDLVSQTILFFPHLLAAAVIFGLGWIATRWASAGLQRMLARENLPRASLVALFANIALIVFFSAMALMQLGIAREVVIIGFATVFVVLGILAVLMVAKAKPAGGSHDTDRKGKDDAWQ
jgi:hypothetical protein